MLVGRDRERRELARLLADARGGRSGVLALAGEAGIGKSALLDAAAGEATTMRVLRARGVESEARVPFGGLFELLRPALGALARVPPPQAEALERALALRPRAAQDRFAVGAATLSLLAAYAEEQALLVLVDDAHLLDRPTADALLFAMRRLVADPIAVVVAVRAGEPSLIDGTDVPTLLVTGLDRDAARALVGLSPALADRLYDATAGNPLALLELAADADELATLSPAQPLPVSVSVAGAFLRRVRGLSERARDALLLAATSDTGDLAVLVRAGLHADDLREAERADLVRLGGGTIEFRHPLVRSAVYGEADADARRAAHRAIADALPDRDADRRAWHLAAAAAGIDEAASVALEQAARRARDRTAFAVASSAFERAARLTGADDRRARLLHDAADAAFLGGVADRARALLDEAAAVRPSPDIDTLRGEIAVRSGSMKEGYALLLAAAERAQPSQAVRILTEAAEACFFIGAGAEMLVAAERAASLAEQVGDDHAVFYAAVARGQARVLAGLDGRDDLLRASALFQSGVFGDDPRVLAHAAMVTLFLRQADVGRALIDRAIGAAREHVAVGALPRLLNRLARDQATSDRWREAEATFHETIRLAREAGQRAELAAALAGLAWLESRQGRTAECRAHAFEARELSIACGIGFFELWTYAAIGELELALGRPEDAVRSLELHEGRALEIGVADVDMSSTPELVEAYARLARVDDARRIAGGYEQRARAKGQPWALARAARARGLVEDEFESYFEAALDLHRATPDVFEAARTRLAYGARLRRARRRVRAREHLRAAIEAFDALGPTPWAEIARAELAASGETARRRDASTLDDLTPQELQIARLLAGGMTTREAAAAVFLSPKTIEYHLRSIYRKLDLNSRSALAEAVATGGAPGAPESAGVAPPEAVSWP
jgi:DNA-binding CsgD family transcriptional regulator